MSNTCFKCKGSSKEGGCIYSYAMVHFTCISISSLVFWPDEPSDSKHVADIIKLKYWGNVRFIGLYCII
jgi:hypothetical protein